MQLEEAVLYLSSLNSKDKSYLLAIMLHDITAYARDTYVDDSERVSDPRKLRFYNDLQHKLAGKLMVTIVEDDQSYPDDAFLSAIFDLAEYGGFIDDLYASLERSIQVVMKRPTSHPRS